MDNRISIMDLKAKKKRGERIVMITCYDYPSARLLEAADVDILFIGDTLGMTVLGYDSTIPVTMDEMLHHTKAVVRGSSSAHVLADMPFMSYQTSPEDALRNAGRLLKEGGAQSVKLEGGVHVAETVRFLVDAGIPVMGHIGLTPQSINQLGGYKVQGKTPASAVRLVNDAVALERAGAYAIVLECVPAQLASTITERLTIPTIGIGAGLTATARSRCSMTCSASSRTSCPSTPRDTPRSALRSLRPSVLTRLRSANAASPPKRNPSSWDTAYSQRQQRSPRGQPPCLPPGPGGAPRLRGYRPSFACRPPLHRPEPLGAVFFERRLAASRCG